MKDEKSLTIPKTIQELVSDEQNWIQRDILNGILNQEPPKQWIKTHPLHPNVRYLPIDKHEYLLKRLFQQNRVEILREGQIFQSMYVVVRVHYVDPISSQWTFQDGIGAQDVQTKKGSSPADLANINHGAVMIGFPAAESFAIKDACEKIGKLFGSDLNRKDTMAYTLEKNTVDAFTSEDKKKEYQEIIEGLELVFDLDSLEKYFNQLDLKDKADKEILKLFRDKKTQLKNEAA